MGTAAEALLGRIRSAARELLGEKESDEEVDSPLQRLKQKSAPPSQPGRMPDWVSGKRA